MKCLIKIIGILSLCMLLLSCGSTKRLTLIKSSYEQGDVLSLINALEQYPSHRGYIEWCIYGIDYSDTDYGRLKKYADATKNNVEASIFFDSLLIHKRTFIIDSLSHLSIADVGAFYHTNYKDHDYLKDVIREAYFSDVTSLDYKSRKVLYNAFRNTDLRFEIEKPYHELRDSLLTDIMGVLNPYFKSERDVLKQIEKAVRYETQHYIESGVEKIVAATNEKNERGLFKKIFQRKDIDKYSFNEYVNKVINETFDYSFIENLTRERLSEYLKSSNEMRAMLFNQYFNDYEYQNIYIPDNSTENTLIWVIGRDDVTDIQNIRDTGTALTIGSLALGFVPGIGAVALAADVADLVYGLSQDGRINQAIEKLASTIYNDSLLCIGNYLTSVFGNLTESQQTTENNIRRIYNDEF